MDKNKITIAEIAKMCKVGTSTVSRVINNKYGVKDSTQKKILDVIEKYNYVPNKSAQNLKRITSNCIGLVVKEFSNPFFSEMIKIIEERLGAKGYSIALHQVKSELDEIKESVSFCKENKLEGVIFLGGRFNHSTEVVKRIPIPFVFCTFSNKFGNCDSGMYSSVSIDDEYEAYKGIKYLIDLGHEKIAFMGVDTKDNSISELRYRGYLRALEESKISLNKEIIISTGEFDLKNVYESTSELIKKLKDFTALFIISDSWVQATYKAFSDANIKIPEDVSILGFDGIEIGKYSIPTITTLKQPTIKMAKESVDIIIELVNKGEGNRHLTFETKMIIGSSCKKVYSNL